MNSKRSPGKQAKCSCDLSPGRHIASSDLLLIDDGSPDLRKLTEVPAVLIEKHLRGCPTCRARKIAVRRHFEKVMSEIRRG